MFGAHSGACWFAISCPEGSLKNPAVFILQQDSETRTAWTRNLTSDPYNQHPDSKPTLKSGETLAIGGVDHSDTGDLHPCAPSNMLSVSSVRNDEYSRM